MSKRPDLNQLSAEQLRALVTGLFDRAEKNDRALVHRDAVIEKLTHELAILKRHKYAQRSEQLDALQGNLLDELVDGDLAAIEAELAQLTVDETPAKPKRAPLPPELPRTLIHHEPENTQCHKEDFTAASGSEKAFIEERADPVVADRVAGTATIKFVDYDRTLNSPANFSELR